MAKKTANTAVVTKTVNPILAATLREANKTEKDRLVEKVEQFLEVAIIDCKQQIGERETSVIPRIVLQLKKAEQDLNKAKKDLQKAELSIPDDNDFKTYLENIAEAEEKVYKAEQAIEEYEYDIEVVKKQVEKLKVVLSRLSA